jgi:hypothetical protein
MVNRGINPYCYEEHHCCPVNSLSHRERVGERGYNKITALFYIPSSWPSPWGRRDSLFF